jgi:hypothetical protein
MQRATLHLLLLAIRLKMNCHNMNTHHKILPLLLVGLCFMSSVAFAQTTSFDVYQYQAPQFFIKSELPSRLQFAMTNNDTSFCIISLYKSNTAQKDTLQNIMAQWNEQVVKRLLRASKKPTQILKGQLQDGWASALATGNFYQAKKKCIVMLYSFRKDNATACVVYAFSDKIFKGPIEKFSKNLHLLN